VIDLVLEVCAPVLIPIAYVTQTAWDLIPNKM
jgi:hypothetical protein